MGTVDEEVWSKTEPGTPKPIMRMEAMQKLVEAVVKAATEHKAMYLAPNVLHLKPGSREWFMPFLREAYPHLYPEHQRA